MEIKKIYCHQNTLSGRDCEWKVVTYEFFIIKAKKKELVKYLQFFRLHSECRGVIKNNSHKKDSILSDIYYSREELRASPFENWFLLLQIRI